jgi:hypothetical protein
MSMFYFFEASFKNVELSTCLKLKLLETNMSMCKRGSESDICDVGLGKLLEGNDTWGMTVGERE